jgi:GPH family glycoside/pentoside/hexuronide:cation symporter
MVKDANQTSGEQLRAAVALSTEESETAQFAALAVDQYTAGEKLRLRERVAYGVGDIGGNLIFAPISAFLLFYFTDTVGIGPAIAGTLLLFGRVLDGTMDLIIGTLIDKTSTRWGKARPWLLFSTPVVVLTFIGLFNVPAGLPEGGREAYAFIFYFLCLGVGFVGSNLAYHTLLSVITSDTRSRVSLTVIRTFCAIATTLVVQLATVPLLTAFGGGQAGWTVTSIIYGLVAAVTLLTVFLGTKERVKPVREEDKSSKQPLGKLLKLLIKNPYFLLGFALFLLTYLLSGAGSVGIYFAKDVLGDPGLFGFLGLAQLAPLLIGMWFMPAIIGRLGKRLPVLVGLVITLAGIGVTFIDPSNVGLIVAGGLIRAVGGIPSAAALFALIADIVDYGEWKSGIRADGMTYAAATAGQNFGAGLGAALVGWLLAAAAYDGTLEVQPQSAIDMEIFLFLGLPLITTALQIVIMYFLNIDKHMSVMQRELAARRATGGASDATTV